MSLVAGGQQFIGQIRAIRVETAVSYLMAFFLPWEAVGLTVNDYLISPSTLIGLVFAVFVVLYSPLNARRLLALSLMLMWYAAVTILRFPLSSFLPSLILLCAFALPATVGRVDEEVRSLAVRGFQHGFVFVIAFVSFEIALNFTVPAVFSAIESILVPESRSQSFLGVVRTKGLMMEPANFAIYLCISYFIFDALELSGAGLFGRQKLASIVCLLLTLSLSGIIIITAYLSLRLMSGLLRSLIFRRGLKKAILKRTILVLLFAVVLTAINWDELSGIFGLIWYRASTIFTAIDTFQHVGSVGSRTNAIPVMFKFWANNWPLGAISGTGYANYEGWLVQNFAQYGLHSSFARGEINSIIAVIGLSTGVVGLALYGVFFSLICLSIHRRHRGGVIVIFLLIQLSSGYLINYLFWQSLFLIMIIFSVKDQSRMGYRTLLNRLRSGTT